jgi:hypothetical protein
VDELAGGCVEKAPNRRTVVDVDADREPRGWCRSGAYACGMRLEGIRAGDIVEVDRRGRRFHALVSENGSGGFGIEPLDRRITYRSCRAHEVIAHWVKRGRSRAGSEPVEPSALQLELDTTVGKPKVENGSRRARP